MSYRALDTAEVRRIIDIVGQHMPQEIAELSQLAKIPSVSFEGHDAAEVERSAEAVASAVRDLGVFDTVDIVRAKDAQGMPAVIAFRPAKAGAKRVLLYAHHDVQPVGNIDEWNSEPYLPTLQGDRLFGRGVSDDKAGIASHLGAIRALQAVHADLNVGLSLFIEGEEEAGSPTFKQLLEEHRDIFDADAIIVADSGNWSTETPALTSSLRGNVVFNVTVRTLDHPIHSGQYGGMVPDATMALVKMLSTLWNDDGSLAVSLPQGPEIAYPDYSEAQLRAETGLLPDIDPVGGLREIWGKPSVTVTGMTVPSLSLASNTLLASATAKISARVAPGTDPQEVLELLQRFLTDHAPFGVVPEFSAGELGASFSADLDGVFAQDMLQSMHEAWEVEPVAMGMGGSIPFIATLKALFPRAEVLVTGVEDPDSRAHSPNESQHLGVLNKATAAEALFLARINNGRVAE